MVSPPGFDGAMEVPVTESQATTQRCGCQLARVGQFTISNTKPVIPAEAEIQIGSGPCLCVKLVMTA